MIQHDFEDSLDLSRQYTNAPWWESVYRKAFVDFDCMTVVQKDGVSQRSGIDRAIHLTSGKTLWVDEKVRSTEYNDILLEYWSVEGRSLGWVAKELLTDYIAYAFVQSQRCYLIPFLPLRQAWRKHGSLWKRMGERRIEGFKEIRAQNPGYVTVSVAVPIPVLFKAIHETMVLSWQ